MRIQVLALFVAAAVVACAQQPAGHVATLTPAGEPGEPLVCSGRVVGADGETPVAGAIVYAYQTDAKGLYSPEHDSSNPRIRGWMKTDAQGRWELRSVRPGSYPGTRNPAHIHFEITPPGGGAKAIDEIWFEGDPYLTESLKQRAAAQGKFSPIRRLARGADGVWRCAYDIRLARR